MLKKFGMVTVGVTAGLLAVAPLASASEGHDHHEDKGHHKSHGDHKHHGHKGFDGGDQRGVGNIQCAGEGGSAQTANEGGLIQAGSILSGNGGQLASCNSILNNVLDDNELNIASSL